MVPSSPPVLTRRGLALVPLVLLITSIEASGSFVFVINPILYFTNDDSLCNSNPRNHNTLPSPITNFSPMSTLPTGTLNATYPVSPVIDARLPEVCDVEFKIVNAPPLAILGSSTKLVNTPSPPTTLGNLGN